MLPNIDWSVFWSAFGALVSFAALVGGAVVAFRAFLQRRTWTNLQAVLDHERQQYEESAFRVALPREEFQQQSAAEQYIKIVDESLLALAKVPRVERKEIRNQLRDLLGKLRETHSTLVEALNPFMIDDAKEFIERFGLAVQKFGATFDGDKIASNARTHCDDVAQLAREVADDLSNEKPKIDNEIISGIRYIGYEIGGIDNNIIVPTMLELLTQTKVELSLIDVALKSGQMDKAIWLKERFRFEIERRYQELKSALRKMDELASKY
jgi:hypothetical protein